MLTATETSRKAVAAAMKHLELDGLVPWLRTCGSMEEGGTVTGIVGEGQSQGRTVMMEVSETGVRGANWG